MATLTKNFVTRYGITAGGNITTSGNFNGLTLTANATGWTVSGGTTAVAVTFAGGAAYTLSGTNGQTYTFPATGGTLVTSSGVVTSFSAASTGLTPSTSTTGAITLGGTLAAANGGTGQSSYTVGDILYASTTTALSKLADVATGNALISGGVGAAPSWGKIGISTHVSGLGTGVATFLGTPSSANLASALTDETGTGVAVFNTSPTINTSIVAGSASMDIFNTTATTVNAFGAATALSLGAATGTTTVNNSLTVTGNLTVNGTTTTVNSTTVTVDDPIFVIGGDTAPAADDNLDRGIEFRWHNGTAAKLGFFGFDDSTGYFTFIPDATDTSGVLSGTTGSIQANLVGNADTATKWATARTVTFAGGDVTGSFSIDGSADVSNVSLTIAANSVALGTDTTGNYVATIAGTANQVSVSGSGSETAAVTLSLPQDIATTSTPTFAGTILANSAISSDTVTVNANSTPTTIDTFSTATYTAAEYLVQMKQGTKMTLTKFLVMYDGTDVDITEYAIMDATAGAANATITASFATNTVTVSASSSDAATTNVVIKSHVTYIKA